MPLHKFKAPENRWLRGHYSTQFFEQQTLKAEHLTAELDASDRARAFHRLPSSTLGASHADNRPLTAPVIYQHHSGHENATMRHLEVAPGVPTRKAYTKRDKQFKRIILRCFNVDFDNSYVAAYANIFDQVLAKGTARIPRKHLADLRNWHTDISLAKGTARIPRKHLADLRNWHTDISLAQDLLRESVELRDREDARHVNHPLHDQHVFYTTKMKYGLPKIHTLVNRISCRLSELEAGRSYRAATRAPAPWSDNASEEIPSSAEEEASPLSYAISPSNPLYTGVGPARGAFSGFIGGKTLITSGQFVEEAMPRRIWTPTTNLPRRGRVTLCGGSESEWPTLPRG